MAANINYYCSCMSAMPIPPPPHLPSSSASYHPLHTLFFCEECDAVRCNRCVSVEVSGYYCPNCLFEVPSASVRAEKNRCARNCFQCPRCRNTLSVVPSDPPEDIASHVGAMGEPPFLLYCNNCRWDSAEVGITFEKPTGLAQQLQRSEDSAPEFLEFERLKDFFEPILRASLSTSQQGHGHSPHVSALTAAASSALARDIPGVGKHSRSRLNKVKHTSGSKDDIPVYRARVEASGASGLGAGGDGDVETMRTLERTSDIARLEQRWTNSWSESPRAQDLKPIRIPLHSRLTKRCPACRHILIKPEQKAQVVRYKIKLVAANYLPAIHVSPPNIQTSTRRTTSISQRDDDSSSGKASMQAGRTYPFQLSFTNPLYDPIQVRLAVQRQQVPLSSVEEADKPRRPPFAISLPTVPFSVSAFAEAWEYEDEEEMYGMDHDGGSGDPSISPERTKMRTKTVGILEKKANTTILGGEVVIGKDARGDVKFNMLVSYTYRSDEPQDEAEGDEKTRGSAKSTLETKTFSFYTVVNLGSIVARDDSANMDIS